MEELLMCRSRQCPDEVLIQRVSTELGHTTSRMGGLLRACDETRTHFALARFTGHTYSARSTTSWMSAMRFPTTTTLDMTSGAGMARPGVVVAVVMDPALR